MKFDWQMLGATKQAQWQSLDELASFTPQQPYQYVDLLGEGLAGVLYQDSGAWWYRAPSEKKISKTQMRSLGTKRKNSPLFHHYETQPC